jgi:hypothetical protein
MEIWPVITPTLISRSENALETIPGQPGVAVDDEVTARHYLIDRLHAYPLQVDQGVNLQYLT